MREDGQGERERPRGGDGRWSPGRSHCEGGDSRDLSVIGWRWTPTKQRMHQSLPGAHGRLLTKSVWRRERCPTV
jgi:hypothetical protein